VTEEQWLACTDPVAMLDAAVRNDFDPSGRKLTLFNSACGRRIWSQLPELHRRWVEMGELVADGLANQEALVQAERKARASEDVVRFVAFLNPPMWPYYRGAPFAFFAYCIKGKGELQTHAALLRDQFGPLPFRLMSIDPRLLRYKDGLLVRLARSAYEERLLPSEELDPAGRARRGRRRVRRKERLLLNGELDHAHLLILADALEEAGCDNPEILDHLRQQGQVHARGCWVVDAALGRE
jgi:hypothetical protein